MNLEIVPFGNAKMDDKQVSCQHGVGECDANSYEQCMIYSYPDPNLYLPMLACLEEKLPMGKRESKFPVNVFEMCARNVSLDFAPIQECHDDVDMAWKILKQAADATSDYHDHVPWIEIDGIYMNEETREFMEEICKAYQAKGGSHPACDKERDVELQSEASVASLRPGVQTCPCVKRAFS